MSKNRSGSLDAYEKKMALTGKLINRDVLEFTEQPQAHNAVFIPGGYVAPKSDTNS